MTSQPPASPPPRAHTAHIRIRDAGHGYDVFGMHPRAVAKVRARMSWIYQHYFRVRSYGAHNIPASGPAILAANHSGTLPIDGMMLYLDVIEHTEPTRVPRAVVDRFVPRLPFIGTMFARAGVVCGTRSNFHRLLDDGELLMVFPEGTPGVSKRFRDRYRLQPWRVGHVELAIRHRAPIIPIAIIGAEEQWPTLLRIDGIHLFGVPHLPVPATPVPLPVRYHIHYGAPIDVHEGLSPEAADDPDITSAIAARIAASVQSLIERGLAQRTGIFR